MLLIDTSVWVKLFRKNSDNFRQTLIKAIDGRDYYLSRFTQTELLQGCLDDQEWSTLNSYLEVQDYIEPSVESWTAAARIYYDLRRQGITVRNTIDCCIAASAIEHGLLLLHIDKDFEAIALGTPLNQVRLTS
ncbi:MAG: PIN domain-containing protein [Pleurocapsa sp. MO_226.B13]|nr:PIN domain-containing protein [Pleurocapsa sp. MO_226.B13]